MPLSAAFFDVGHTLLHETPSRFAIYAEVARAHGIATDAARMKASMKAAHAALPREWDGVFRYSDAWFEAFIERIFGREHGLDAQGVARVTEELFARFEDPRQFRLYPGAREVLFELRAAGLFLGVISNWSARLERLLAAVDLRAAFDCVLCSAVERAEKPEAALFERALARAGVPPHRAVHAGDRADLDVAGARAVGMQAVLVDHAGDADREERAPDAAAVPRVASLPELSRWILERSA